MWTDKQLSGQIYSYISVQTDIQLFGQIDSCLDRYTAVWTDTQLSGQIHSCLDSWWGMLPAGVGCCITFLKCIERLFSFFWEKLLLFPYLYRIYKLTFEFVSIDVITFKEDLTSLEKS